VSGQLQHGGEGISAGGRGDRLRLMRARIQARGREGRIRERVQDLQSSAGGPARRPGRRICRARPVGGRFRLTMWPVPRIGFAKTSALNLLFTAMAT
jgi:hypothetical protein